MFVLDTDTFTHLLHGHERVTLRRSQVTEEVVLTAVTRIEVLQGRFASVMKAEDAEQLLLAQQRLAQSEQQLASFDILPVDAAAAAEFQRLLGTKGLRRLGRGDLLIAAIVLVNKATLVTRNRKDFAKVPGLKIENWAD
jgi:tRNA(fMet)-specific endonuclease VapC